MYSIQSQYTIDVSEEGLSTCWLRIESAIRRGSGGGWEWPRTKEYKSLVVCLYQDFRQSFQAFSFLDTIARYLSLSSKKPYLHSLFQRILECCGKLANDVLFTGPNYADVHAALGRLLSPTPPQPPKSTQLLLRIIIHQSPIPSGIAIAG